MNILNEIGNDISNIYPFQLLPPNSGHYDRYGFSTESKEYVVSFFPKVGGGWRDTYVREYNSEDLGKISANSLTGEHKAIKVNATVMAITIDWLDKHKDNEFFKQLIIEPVDNRRHNIVMRFINNTIAGEYDIIDDKPMIIVRKKESNDMDEPLDEVTYRYKEGRNTVPNRMDFDTQKLIDSGAIVICKGMNGDPKSSDYKKHLNDGSTNLITLYNIEHALKKSPDSWILEAIKYPITNVSKVWKNVALETYDGKYNQILWSLKKLGIPYEEMLKSDSLNESIDRVKDVMGLNEDINFDDIVFFKTSQGSKYIRMSDGRLRRYKSYHANTGGEDEGLHPWSDLSVFVESQHNKEANSIQFLVGNGFKNKIALSKTQDGKIVVVVYDNNDWRPATWNDAYPGYVKRNEQYKDKPLVFPYVKEPTVGYHVVDFNMNNGYLKSYHFGSDVSEISEFTDEDKKLFFPSYF